MILNDRDTLSQDVESKSYLSALQSSNGVSISVWILQTGLNVLSRDGRASPTCCVRRPSPSAWGAA